MEDQNKKYYWLKLKRDFFKRHDIRIIEEMPNGKDYILFYLKLLCESVDHEGMLRFSEAIPYSDSMLATITNTNIDIVRSAVKLFTELQMMEIMDDGSFYMGQVQKMIGVSNQDEHTRESTRLRVQAFRERQKQAKLETERYSNVTCNGELDIEKELDIELEKEKEIDKESDIKGVRQSETAQPTKRFIKPSIDQVRAYCHERGDKVDPERFFAYYEANGWSVGKRSMKDWKAAIRYWETDPTRQPQQPQRKGNYFVPSAPTEPAEAYTSEVDDVTEEEEEELMQMLRGGKE